MRTIRVKVKVRAKKNFIQEKDGILVVSVIEPAREGRANEAVVRALSEYFGVRKSDLRIRMGLHSREKIIEIR